MATLRDRNKQAKQRRRRARRVRVGAAEHVRQALHLRMELDDKVGTAWALTILAEIACEARHYMRAATLIGAAERLLPAPTASSRFDRRLRQ